MKEASSLEYEKLFRQNHQGLCDLAYNIVHDSDAAKDIVQEVFLKLWKNKEQLLWGEKIKHYLFKATAHTALNHLRFKKKIFRLEDNEALINTLVADADTENIEFKELEIRVRKAIDTLPPKCKVIYLLSRQEGMKYQEIAETLNLSLKTVENQMGIALQKLREKLKPFLTKEFLALLILAFLTLLYLLS